MKKVTTWIVLITSLSMITFPTTSCQKQIEQQQTAASIDEAAAITTSSRKSIPHQIHFTERGLYPEGIAFDKFNNRFVIGSFGRGTIGAVSSEGDYTPLIQDPDLKSTLGLHIDEARKRIVTAVTDGLFGDVAKVGVYDMQTGDRLWLIDLAALHPGGVHLAVDLAIDPRGNIYITDAKSPVLYKVDANGNASVFFENQLFAEPPGFPFYWVGFNGIVYDNSGFLLVSFYAGGQLIKIPVNDPQRFSVVQFDIPFTSGDGLLLSKDGKDLIVVDNVYLTDAAEIVHFESKDNWTSAKRVESFPTGLTSPTTATSDGKDVFVIYSYLFDVFFGVPFTNSEFTIKKMPFDLKNF